MKTHEYISVLLLVVASALLPSCILLDSSPLHTPRPHPPIADSRPSSYLGDPHRNSKVYNKSFEVPVDGGIYEFDNSSNQLYFLSIFDSSMSEPQKLSDDRYSPAESGFIMVDDLTYTGQFYTITCNKDKHKWAIEVEPLQAAPDEEYYREIMVFMWDGSDNTRFVFRFEQIDDYDYGSIE